MIKHLIFSSLLVGALLWGCTPKEPVAEETTSLLPKAGKEYKDGRLFDSLRVHSPFTDAQFASLRQADSVQWRLVTDLLNYYYSLRWTKENTTGALSLEVQTIEQRLRKVPALWSFPKDLSPEKEYAFLLKGCARISDFPVDGQEEKRNQEALLQFMKSYLSARCEALLNVLPKSSSLTRALESESTAWQNYVQAETVFYNELSALQYADHYSKLGMKKGEFLDTRRVRREDTERVTYFALASPSYGFSHMEYVTWAETQQEYATLQERLYQNGKGNLKATLAKESVAWFAFVKARTAVEELLGGSALQAYAAQTRILKGDHLKDLKTWGSRPD